MSKRTLMDDMVKFVDPDTYDGAWCHDCLLGQVDKKSPVVKEYVERVNGALQKDYERGTYSVPRLAALAYKVDEYLVDDIYSQAAFFRYRNNLPAALDMARSVLGITEAKQ